MKTKQIDARLGVEDHLYREPGGGEMGAR